MMYHDLTLRDGCHAISHKLSRDLLIKYCEFATNVGIKVLEVGHGNGLGASSQLIGESLLSDIDLIKIAKQNLPDTLLSVHLIPGIATIQRDVIPAMDAGVDIFRVASHCTEASITKSHIEYICSKGKTVYGALMMTAKCSVDCLVDEAQKMKSYGANGVIVMDSSGSFTPDDVEERILALKKLDIKIGFHAHNNIHLAVTNSITAIKCGADIIDVTLKGFGAGAGNTPLEIMNHVYPENGLKNDEILKGVEKFDFKYPVSKPVNILTSFYKMFSGFEKHIIKASEQYNIPITTLTEKLNEKELVAGQEDFIYIVANSLKS